MTYRIEKTICEISSTGSTRKLLTLTSWASNPAKLDLRIWREKDGERIPNKGVTLTRAEAETLQAALSAYLEVEKAQEV